MVKQFLLEMNYASVKPLLSGFSLAQHNVFILHILCNLHHLSQHWLPPGFLVFFWHKSNIWFSLIKTILALLYF